jgi:hypothetical protein
VGRFFSILLDNPGGVERKRKVGREGIRPLRGRSGYGSTLSVRRFHLRLMRLFPFGERHAREPIVPTASPGRMRNGSLPCASSFCPSVNSFAPSVAVGQMMSPATRAFTVWMFCRSPVHLVTRSTHHPIPHLSLVLGKGAVRRQLRNVADGTWLRPSADEHS